MSGPETIQTDRLLLRALELSDAPRVAELAGDREIAATTLLIPHPYAVEDAERWVGGRAGAFATGESATWAVCVRDSAAEPLIGAVGLVFKRDHDRAEMGYWIGKPWWGRGYATEAARAVVRFAFQDLGLNRVEAHHFGHNPASGRVLEKAGLRREGVLRAHVKKWGEYEDCVLYAVLRGEWRAAGRGGVS